MDQKIEIKYEYSIEYSSNEIIPLKDNINIISEVVIKNSDDELELMLEVENASDVSYEFSSQDIAVNGLVAYSGAWDTESLTAGRKAVETVDVSDVLDDYISELFQIDTIGTVSMNVVLEDANYKPVISPVNVTVELQFGGTFSDNGQDTYDSNGIQLKYIGITEDESTYSYSGHIVFLAQNNTDKSIIIDDKYDSFSLNGFMADCACYSIEVAPGCNGIVDIELQDYYLEDLSIESIDDITSAEITFEIRDSNYRSIDDVTLAFDFTK